jgi:[acyl-carrier-protein] S-malonyltransferase
MAMLAIIAPGQGSQTPGMLSAWLKDSTLRDTCAAWSLEIGIDLLTLGTSADADEIKDTANAQPLIVAAGLLSFKALGVTPSVVAGHSVGEITAASVATIISENDAMKIVQARGVEMAKAAAMTPAGMSAVLGGDREAVVAAITAAGLVAANENGAGQIVAAGSLEGLEKLAANPPEGARVRALAVAGAFHTSYMQPAIEPLRVLAANTHVHDPIATIISNKEGARVTNGREFMDCIVAQIANPVRWDLCMSTLKSMGVTGVIELAPAGTLVGLLKRAEPSIESFALKSPDDLDAAQTFAANHGSN